jgi:hypothetical protein
MEIFGAINVEQRPFDLLSKSSAGYQVRRYHPSVWISSDRSNGFGKLAGFIFGKTQDSKPIAMTAPVITDSNTMSFVLPSSYKSVDQVPTPQADVLVREMPAVEMAVLPFSGRATTRVVQEKVQELKQMLAKDRLEVDDASLILSQFNPPWTLPWLRYNEIAFRLLKTFSI